MENENQNYEQEPNRFEAQNMGTTPSYYKHTYVAPRPKKKHFGLALAGLILSGISLVFSCGLTVIPALIGTIFGLIALIKGKDASVRVMGGIALGIGILAVFINAALLIWVITQVDWSMMTPENMEAMQNIDYTNQQEVIDWYNKLYKNDITLE